MFYDQLFLFQSYEHLPGRDFEKLSNIDWSNTMAQTGAEIKDNEVSRKKSNATQRTCLTKETLEQPLGIMTVFETFNFKYIIYLPKLRSMTFYHFWKDTFLQFTVLVGLGYS